ncbi:hypothetical protein PHLGIDRAFT_334043 [Phlebiopsis gigantea 11061_1 CR5-6]|uniref:Uncharacterized protein n=1 Tax=Phlebiopsis gigantea (strain 11061_1 CR5-6) TaxID=745531 RepID=A0A0C3SAN1_PHLG1|nr:hypothetical protein PHLGIDRAFT_334043 [Phlebiopsis gigantea 11061_1 CR5-6]
MSVETDLLASVVEIIAQSLVYGVFIVLMPISTVILAKRRNRNAVTVLIMIWIMFALSTAHWAVGVAFLAAKASSLTIINGSLRATFDLMNAVAMINFAIADSVVVWRAWVVCKDTSRKPLLAAAGCLGLTIAAISATICLRIAANINDSGQGRDHRKSPVDQALVVAQVASAGASVLTNMISTSTVGLYIWNYRRTLSRKFEERRMTRPERVLMLLVESGFVYSFYAVG